MATKSEVIGEVLALTSIIAAAAIALQKAQTTLTTAHAEAWSEDDPRWAPQFDAAHAARKTAQDRL